MILCCILSIREVFLIFITYEKSEDNENLTQRVQNSKLLLSIINYNSQFAEKKKGGGIYMITQQKTEVNVSLKFSWCCLFPCTSFTLIFASVMDTQYLHFPGLRNEDHCILHVGRRSPLLKH